MRHTEWYIPQLNSSFSFLHLFTSLREIQNRGATNKNFMSKIVPVIFLNFYRGTTYSSIVFLYLEAVIQKILSEARQSPRSRLATIVATTDSRRFAIPCTKWIRGTHSRNEFDYPAWHESVDPCSCTSRYATRALPLVSFRLPYNGCTDSQEIFRPLFKPHCYAPLETPLTTLHPLPRTAASSRRSLLWRPPHSRIRNRSARNSSRVSRALWSRRSRGNLRRNKSFLTRARIR